MTNVLVIGAGRGVGLETVWQALDKGMDVRAMARSASSIEIEHRNLEKIDGDATSYDDVLRAVDNCDVIITTLGIGPTFKDVTIFSDTAANVIKAMKEKNVSRLIAVTGLGAGDSNDTGGLLVTKFLRPFFLGTIYVDKTREENLIRQSGLEWTIVRPGILTRLPKRGDYKVLIEPHEWRSGFITRGDVADFLINQIETEGLIGKTPAIIND